MNIKIQQCLDRFPFKKVEALMRLLDWQYHESGVPSLAQLKMCAQELLTEVANEDFDGLWIETGGFRSSKRNEEGSIKLELEFIPFYSWSD